MKSKIVNAYPDGVEFYKDATGDWRWRITATNHEIIGSSSEGFRNRQDCERNFLMVGKSITESKTYKYYVASDESETKTSPNENGPRLL